VPATWKTGVLTVPSSTGSTAVTGLGGTPAAVFFFGTNWLTEDTAVTGTGTGIFRGMAAPKYDSPSTIVQSCGTIVPAGDQQYFLGQRAILMLDTSGTGGVSVYGAILTSFDTDGFTINWDGVTAGGYKVVYVALMGVANVGAFRGTTNQTGLAFGFKAGASLMHGVWGTGDAGGNVQNNDQTRNWYGGAAYPGSSSSGWMSAGMSAFCTQGSGSTILEMTLDQPNIRVVSGGHGGIGGSFVPADIFAAPSGDLTFMTFNGDGNDSGMIVAWDDEDSATGGVTLPDNEDDTATVSGLPFAPGLLLGYSISDEPDAFANYGAGNGRGANGFSIVTPDFQWTALVDGVSSRGAYQSFQRGFCDRVSGTSVHAGTVELTTDGFVMTTVEDDLDIGSFIWHAFGHPTPFPWIPQIRRHHAGGGRPIVIVVETGYVLLEDGSLILLEDGSGALLL
jgi:hypothetical protein